MTATIPHHRSHLPETNLSATRDWAPLSMTMRGSRRYVVLLRPGGFWGGPEQPSSMFDCLAQPHLHTRQLSPAPVATFPDFGTAWTAWETWYATGQATHHKWTVDYLPLASIPAAQWTGIPPIAPRFALSATDKQRLCRTRSAAPGRA
ncbi:hypothetical protein [Actinocatenispora rupis]|uniref:Uncharacterized protein n=1 Tax=Actinocatenispora rupis TaxID=519421 RepID=A0A8J3JAM1_9ACTN|nr:hypothetical protein [Actinocatenispora rupis]GID14897.1 hypothetical protein Aru02nite_57860 [Actinocatenispora rupis]